jgi:hypothetical protein
MGFYGQIIQKFEKFFWAFKVDGDVIIEPQENYDTLTIETGPNVSVK